MTLIGNSVKYNLTFDYTGTNCVAPITTFEYTNTALFNNRVTGIYQSPNRIINPSFTLSTVTAGNYEIPVTISTALAGGSGNGSSYTLRIPVQITAADDMGNPVIRYATASLTVTAQNTVTISGIQYYGPGSRVTIPAKWLIFSNFYNIIHDQTLPNYVEFTEATYLADAPSSTTLAHGASFDTPYNPAGNSPPSGSKTVEFANRNALSLPINRTGFISMRVTNNKRDATNRIPFFPVSGLTNGSGSQTSIGYFSSAPDETTIPKGQGGTTISGLSSMTRVSIATATIQGTATDNPAASAIQNFNPATLTNYDVQYNPYTGNFHATDQSASLASTYLLVASPAMPSQSSRKYLTIKVAVTAVLKAFTVKLGNTANIAGNITNLWVKWEDTANNVTSWYNAADYFTETGACGASTPQNNNTVWGIQMNKALDDSGNYKVPSFIYINVRFTDKIKLSEINIV